MLEDDGDDFVVFEVWNFEMIKKKRLVQNIVDIYLKDFFVLIYVLFKLEYRVVIFFQCII